MALEIAIRRFGGPEVLEARDAPPQAPRKGEIRIRHKAIGVNFTDVHGRRGDYAPLRAMPMPLVLGMEAAGVVEAVGDGVAEARPGDRVVFTGVQGAYATHQVVPTWKLVPIPATVESEVAAAAHLQGLTAHYLAHSTYPLKPGDTALVHAAAGGVGGLLVQFAKRCGARVLATVSTEAKAQEARNAGADEVILYTQVDFAAEARRFAVIPEALHIVLL